MYSAFFAVYLNNKNFKTENKPTFLQTNLKVMAVKNTKKAMGFIFITLLIDVMGWGLIIPVMADLIAQLKHIPVNIASTYGAALLSVFAVTQFLFSPVI